MPIDWQATPVPCNSTNKRDGIASVNESKGGWDWKAFYGERQGGGQEPTRAHAMAAANAWIDLQVRLGKEPTDGKAAEA